MTIDNDSISGTLKYVDDYEGFSSNVTEQVGHYLALHVEGGTDLTVEVVGGEKGPVALDSDGIVVLLIRNKNTQSVQVKGKINGTEVTQNYSLSGLTLLAE